MAIMNTPHIITNKAKMTTFQQPGCVHWCTMVNWLDQLSAATDQYFNMMTHTNAYQLTTLQQLMHLILLATLSPDEHPPKPPQPNTNQSNINIVLIPLDGPTPLLANARRGSFSLPTSHTPNLDQNPVLPHQTMHSQKPCATTHPPHKQAPYKLDLSAKPSTYSSRCSHQLLTCQTKDNFHPLAYPTNSQS